MIQIYRKVPSKISTVMIAFDGGARAESEKYSLGLAHFCEHMVFKGTEKRHYLEIPKQIGFLGGSVNAYTSNELVAFHVSAPYENIEQAMEILSDIVFNSTFPEEELLKEKEVVKEEELSGKDSIESMMWDRFCQEYFQHRSKHPVIGTQESISKFSKKELSKFYKEHYKKANAVVSFCSSHSKSEGKKLLTKYFGKASGSIKHNVEIYEPQYPEAKTLEVLKSQLEHSHVWFAYPGNPLGQNEVAEDMMLSILGQGMDSRLFTEVREKRGLCYHIGSSAFSQRDYSAILITSSTREENIKEMSELIEIEVEKMKEEFVSQEELERARNKYRAQTYSMSERSSSLAQAELSRKFFGLCSLEELEQQVKLVSVEDIREVARKVFDNSKRMIIIGKEGVSDEIKDNG